MAGSFLKSLGAALMRGASGLRTQGTVAAPGTKPTPLRAPSSGWPATGGGVVTVTYSPHLDGRPDPGEVVWTWVPFEDDPSQGKDRPVVAIGWDGGSLVVVPFTSKDQHGRPDTYEIGSGRWDSSGRSSWVKLDRLIPVDPRAVRREGAVLDRARFEQLVRRLRAAHGMTLRVTG